MANQTSYKFMVYYIDAIVVVVIVYIIFVKSFVPFISILCISIRLLLLDWNIYGGGGNSATRIDPSHFILWYQFYHQIRK